MQVLQEQKPAQRGNNREVCFIEPENYQFYLQLWQELSQKFEVAVHAYCLMTNHIHFLVTPAEEDSISMAMKRIGSRYVQYINKKYKRTGTLWEGRHKSSLVDAENYLLACYRYIELNPVVAGMVKSPEEYPWSSYHTNAWGKIDSLVVPHEIYLRIHEDKLTREMEYRELFRVNLPVQDVHAIRESLSANQILGQGRFIDQIESALLRKIGFLNPGRPAVVVD